MEHQYQIFVLLVDYFKKSDKSVIAGVMICNENQSCAPEMADAESMQVIEHFLLLNLRGRSA